MSKKLGIISLSASLFVWFVYWIQIFTTQVIYNLPHEGQRMMFDIYQFSIFIFIYILLIIISDVSSITVLVGKKEARIYPILAIVNSIIFILFYLQRAFPSSL
ncbi:MAG: hypothetical protein Q8Q48_00850 [Candidatus Staskawiczbacteria bacterium]|nr:hypothetical protein [Candidatus Staskawiczbacteria bacterium]